MNLLYLQMKKSQLALIILISFLVSFVATSLDFGRANSHSISMHGHANEIKPCQDMADSKEDFSCGSNQGDSHREHGLCQTILGFHWFVPAMSEPNADSARPGEFVIRRLQPILSDAGPGEPPEVLI
jgi:hypothetical protein